MQPDSLQSLHEEARDVAAAVMDRTKDVVFGALFGIWTLGWLVLLGFGWLLGLGTLAGVSGGVLALSWALVLISRSVKRRRLRRAAKSSLIARAKLERIKLGREMQAVLTTFDLAYQRAGQLLSEPELAGQAESLARLEPARDRLFELARDEGRLRGDARRLRSHQGLDSTRAAAADAEREITRVRAEADKIALDTQRLAERLSEVRALARGPGGEDRARAQLGEVLEDLDRTATAYREIDRSERNEEIERARLAAARNAGAGKVPSR